jgi:hypothetical protein
MRDQSLYVATLGILHCRHETDNGTTHEKDKDTNRVERTDKSIVL